MGSRPEPTHQLWPDPERGPWSITLWWRSQHGRAVLVGLDIRSWMDPVLRGLYDKGGLEDWGLPVEDADASFPVIDSKFLKSLPIGHLQAQVRDALLQMVDTGFLAPGEGSSMAEVVDRWKSGGGGRGLNDEHYEEVAAVYRKAASAGLSPTKAVAEHFTVSKSAAAKKVARARERGLLPPTTRGRVGPLREEL